MNYQTTVPSENSVDNETLRPVVSQAEVNQAEADYCKAMCQYSHNSAEVLVAHRYWMHLKEMLRLKREMARSQHSRSRALYMPYDGGLS